MDLYVALIFIFLVRREGIQHGEILSRAYGKSISDTCKRTFQFRGTKDQFRFDFSGLNYQGESVIERGKKLDCYYCNKQEHFKNKHPE